MSRYSEGFHLDELHLSGLASVGKRLENLHPDVLVSGVSHANMHAVDHASDDLLGEANDFEGLVIVTGLGLNLAAEAHEEFESFSIGLLSA